MSRSDHGLDAWMEEIRPYLDAETHSEGVHELHHERREWNRVCSIQAKQRDEYLTDLIDTKRRLRQLQGSKPLVVAYGILTALILGGAVWWAVRDGWATAAVSVLMACFSAVLGISNLPRRSKDRGDDHDQP